MKRFTKIIATIILLVAVVCTMGFTLPEGEQTGNGSYNGHEYVDLGLPSGTLWATCNLGADAPEDYGYYYAWGETTTKSTYSWKNYRYCNGSSGSLTKYCNISKLGNNGFTDDLIILQPGDDAATVNWGGDWRIPTKEELRELFSNTTLIWTTKNDVCGMLLIASNGNSLFLPAAGVRYDNEINATGSVGLYWSSLLDTGFTYMSWHLQFDSKESGTWWTERRLGQSVRPVFSKR